MHCPRGRPPPLGRTALGEGLHPPQDLRLVCPGAEEVHLRPTPGIWASRLGSGTGAPQRLGTDRWEARDYACLTRLVAETAIGDAPFLGKVSALRSGHPDVRARPGKAGQGRARSIGAGQSGLGVGAGWGRAEQLGALWKAAQGGLTVCTVMWQNTYLACEKPWLGS